MPLPGLSLNLSLDDDNGNSQSSSSRIPTIDLSDIGAKNNTSLQKKLGIPTLNLGGLDTDDTNGISGIADANTDEDSGESDSESDSSSDGGGYQSPRRALPSFSQFRKESVNPDSAAGLKLSSLDEEVKADTYLAPTLQIQDRNASFEISRTGTLRMPLYEIRASGFNKAHHQDDDDDDDSDSEEHQVAVEKGEHAVISSEAIVAEHLVTLGSLGAGACGAVLKSLHVPTLTVIALKTIDISEKAKRDQLVKELKQLETTDSPFLVSFYGAFFADGSTKIALEFMNRGSLEDVVHRFGALNARVVASIAKQMTQGFQYLHDKHKVHRDVKPANILINHKGQCKISDFGIMVELGASDQKRTTFVGTAIYMSPERIKSRAYGTASDIWSMGMVVIFCATSKYPFAVDEGYWGLVAKLCDDDPPSLPDTYPEPMRDFVNKCLIKDPDKRYTAKQLLEHPFLKSALSVWQTLPHWPAECAMDENILKRVAKSSGGDGSSTMERLKKKLGPKPNFHRSMSTITRGTSRRRLLGTPDQAKLSLLNQRKMSVIDESKQEAVVEPTPELASKILAPGLNSDDSDESVPDLRDENDKDNATPEMPSVKRAMSVIVSSTNRKRKQSIRRQPIKIDPNFQSFLSDIKTKRALSTPSESPTDSPALSPARFGSPLGSPIGSPFKSPIDADPSPPLTTSSQDSTTGKGMDYLIADTLTVKQDAPFLESRALAARQLLLNQSPMPSASTQGNNNSPAFTFDPKVPKNMDSPASHLSRTQSSPLGHLHLNRSPTLQNRASISSQHSYVPSPQLHPRILQVINANYDSSASEGDESDIAHLSPQALRRQRSLSSGSRGSDPLAPPDALNQHDSPIPTLSHPLSIVDEANDAGAETNGLESKNPSSSTSSSSPPSPLSSSATKLQGLFSKVLTKRKQQVNLKSFKGSPFSKSLANLRTKKDKPSLKGLKTTLRTAWTSPTKNTQQPPPSSPLPFSLPSSSAISSATTSPMNTSQDEPTRKSHSRSHSLFELGASTDNMVAHASCLIQPVHAVGDDAEGIAVSPSLQIREENVKANRRQHRNGLSHKRNISLSSMDLSQLTLDTFEEGLKKDSKRRRRKNMKNRRSTSDPTVLNMKDNCDDQESDNDDNDNGNDNDGGDDSADQKNRQIKNGSTDSLSSTCSSTASTPSFLNKRTTWKVNLKELDIILKVVAEQEEEAKRAEEAKKIDTDGSSEYNSPTSEDADKLSPLLTRKLSNKNQNRKMPQLLTLAVRNRLQSEKSAKRNSKSRASLSNSSTPNPFDGRHLTDSHRHSLRLMVNTPGTSRRRLRRSLVLRQAGVFNSDEEDKSEQPSLTALRLERVAAQMGTSLSAVLNEYSKVASQVRKEFIIANKHISLLTPVSSSPSSPMPISPVDRSSPGLRMDI